MRNIVERLDKNCVVEEDDGPRGTLVVLEEKLQKENGPWHNYQWRLCVSHQKLNQFTRPLTLPISLCDDAVQDIDTEEKYYIAVDMYSGYWQVTTEEKL